MIVSFLMNKLQKYSSTFLVFGISMKDYILTIFGTDKPRNSIHWRRMAFSDTIMESVEYLDKSYKMTKPRSNFKRQYIM